MRLGSVSLVALSIVFVGCADAAVIDGQAGAPAARPEPTTTVVRAPLASIEVPAPPPTASSPAPLAETSPPVEESTDPDPYGEMRLTVVAAPDVVDDVVPTVRRDGVDLFESNCVREGHGRTPAEVVYSCDDLDAGVHEVAAAIDGVGLMSTCAPLQSFFLWDPTVADLGADGYADCRLSTVPPGVFVELQGVDVAGVSSLEIRTADGVAVDAGCRRIEDWKYTPPADVANLWCDQLPLGRYEIPRQDVDGTGRPQPFTCSPGLAFDRGPGLDQRIDLENRENENGADLAVWTCVNDEPEGPLVARLLLGVEADASIVDELRVAVIRDGVDIFEPACASSVAPLYLDPGTDGFRFYECAGDWWGELAPKVVDPPAGAEVSVTCFEQQPITTVIGPTALPDPDIGEPWICTLVVD